MDLSRRLTDAEIAEIRRRPGARASLACEGLHLTAEEEALLDEFDREHLSLTERDARILAYSRARQAPRSDAAE